MSAVLGLDLSLTSTGLAWVVDGAAEVSRIRSTGRKGATLAQRDARLYDLRAQIALTVEGYPPDLVVIEQPAFSRTTGHMHDRSGLWWLVVADLHLAGIRTVEVAPTARAKYATGKGNAGKDEVLAAVVRRYPAVEVTGNDEADALILAAMGTRHLGQPIEESLPKLHLEAMAKVAWPARDSEPVGA